MDPIGYAQAAVEIHQIDAAAQQDMLAVVYHFGIVARNGIGGSSAAQESPGLKKINLKSGLAQRGSRRKASQTSADHNRRRHRNLDGETVLRMHRLTRAPVPARDGPRRPHCY
jgi:hypothetical protein